MELVDQVTIEGPRMVVRPAHRLAPFVPHDFEVEYPDDVDLATMPRALALLPFLWNVAPIVWAVGGEYELDVLDSRVAESLEALRAEFGAMYPALGWSGSITAREVVEVRSRPAGMYASASLYTGGVDSTWTALRYAGPELLLIRIWGSDVRLEDVDDWRAVADRARGFARTFGGGLAHVRSNFRSINYRRLARLTPQVTDWWTAVQHSMSLAGLAAPLLYHHGIPLLRIGSSFTDAFTTSWASLPRVDDKVSLATAGLVHDSWELSRQAKISRLVAYQREHGLAPWPLIVCLRKLPNRENCGRECEKCVRTVIGLSIVGADPAAYGFANAPPLDEIPAMIEAGRFRFGDDEVYMWGDLQQHARSTQGLEGPFWKWLREFDIEGFRQRQPASPAKVTRYAWLDRRAPRLYDRLRDAKRALRLRLQQR